MHVNVIKRFLFAAKMLHLKCRDSVRRAFVALHFVISVKELRKITQLGQRRFIYRPNSL